MNDRHQLPAIAVLPPLARIWRLAGARARSARWRAAILGLCLVIVAPSCREQLPAYEDPRDLFEADIRPTVVYRSDAIAVDVTFRLVNRFDETLDDVIDVDGWISVVIADDPTTIRTFPLSASQMTAKHYVPSSRRLTVDPGDTVFFRVRYNFVDDIGRSLMTSVMRWRNDPSCGDRLISTQTPFVIQASVRLYSRTDASIAPPFATRWCIPSPWVSDKVCPDRVQPGECP